MGKGLGCLFFKKPYINDQKGHKICLISLITRKTQIKTINEIPPHSHWDVKMENVISVGKDSEKSEALCIVAGTAGWCSYCGKQYGAFSIIKNERTDDPAGPQRHTCTPCS